MMQQMQNWIKSQKTYVDLMLQLANKLDNAVSALDRQPLDVMVQVYITP